MMGLTMGHHGNSMILCDEITTYKHFRIKSGSLIAENSDMSDGSDQSDLARISAKFAATTKKV